MVMHLRTRIYYKLWTLYYKYRLSICSRTLALSSLYSDNPLIPLDSSRPLSLLGRRGLIWLIEPLNHWTTWIHRYLVLTLSRVSLSGHNTHTRSSEQCPMCSDHLISLSPNPSASAHLWAMSCELWHFILPYSYTPPHVTLLYCTWARAWSLIIYLIIPIMSCTHLVFSEHLPLSMSFFI